MTTSDLFLRIFEAYPGTLKRFDTWKRFGNSRMVPILFENPL